MQIVYHGGTKTRQSLVLVVARKQLPETKVYELTRTFIEQKQRFVAISPAVFSGLNESFGPLNLNFPLHDGARHKKDRADVFYARVLAIRERGVAEGFG